jgi:hypothetical protein
MGVGISKTYPKLLMKRKAPSEYVEGAFFVGLGD